MDNTLKAEVEPYVIMLEDPTTGNRVAIRVVPTTTELTPFKSTASAFNELIEQDPTLGDMVLVGFVPAVFLIAASSTELSEEVIPNVVC